ncbi:MAG TPA: glutamyl-tRNA reductase [Chthoniobacterales bacterium]|nr:glutamyl-tRNA reductase [Chthoniobacterales bacterium]
MKLFAAGLSHKTAPVELREQLGVKQSEIVDLAFALKSFGHLGEIVLLSTCNRVEIYGTTRQAMGHIKALLQLLCAEPRDLDPHIYLYEGASAVRHLLRVAAGLDSMVLGETEITGQIKNAYEIARNAGLTGRVLNRLFQRAFQATKEIRTRTGIGRGTVSIKSTAVELIGRTDLSQQSIMVLGAGEMAEKCVRLLVKKGAQSIFISNRSFDRALDLATRCGGEAVCFGYCLFEMRDVDVVIAATSSAETLLSCDDIENLMKARRNRPLLLIDLSVPRNIDPAASQLENVTIYNIDDLEALSRQGAQARERELATCHQIIEAQVAALIKKLESESERMTRTDLFRHSLEATRDISYPLPTTSGLVAQPS